MYTFFFLWLIATVLSCVYVCYAVLFSFICVYVYECMPSFSSFFIHSYLHVYHRLPLQLSTGLSCMMFSPHCLSSSRSSLFLFPLFSELRFPKYILPLRSHYSYVLAFPTPPYIFSSFTPLFHRITRVRSAFLYVHFCVAASTILSPHTRSPASRIQS